VNTPNSIKFNNGNDNNSTTLKQQELTVIVSVQQGVHGAPKTGKC
jgi:hypothetical protein